MEKLRIKNKKGFHRGFTIMELLIYVSIVTVVVTVLTNFIIDVTKTANSSKAAKEVQQNSRLLMSKIMSEVRLVNSDNVVIPVGGGEIRFTDGASPRGFCLISGKVYYFIGSSCAANNQISTDDVAVSLLQFTTQNNAVTITLTVEPAFAVAGSGGQYTLSSTFASRQNVY